MPFDLRQKMKSEQLLWPPPPHDPRKRVRLGHIDEWEVRMISTNDSQFESLARKRMLHLQLWHPLVWVSVLTPSQLTFGRFEVFPFEGWKCFSPCLEFVNRVLREKLGAPKIDERALAILERNLVYAETFRVLHQQDPTVSWSSISLKLEG